ncbi:MAG: AAA family ATPase [Armatimonadetes bacterium]|nr:AAA family ATPase [Anaerolineae bacterium]
MTITLPPPRSLALVGMPGAGKTLCATHLASLGYFQFRFGGIVEDEVVRRGLPVNPENERIVREEFRDQDGMDAIAKRALPHLQTALAHHTSIVIDGLYSFSEYKLLHRELGAAMVIVAIACPRWLRYERLAARPVRPLTREQAELRDYQEIERLEKGGPIAIADFTLVNDGAAEPLLAKLDALLSELMLHP